MALDEPSPRQTRRVTEGSPRGRLANRASFGALGLAAASAAALWLWLKSDVSEGRAKPSSAAIETNSEETEARHHPVSRLGASPPLRLVDAGTPLEAPEDTAADAGAYAKITFVDPVVPPPGEAPALAEDTGLLFVPQADPAHQPGLAAKSDEPAAPSGDEASSIRGPVDRGAPPIAGSAEAADGEAPSAVRPPPASPHEQTATEEDAPPVERSSDTGLVFRNTPSDSK